LGAIDLAFKILICDKIADEGIKLLEEKGYEITKAWDMPKTELPKIAGEYDAIIVRSATKVKGALLANTKKLRVIGRAGEGLDNIDVEKARALGVAVVKTPHVSYVSVAELAIGHLLALARGIVEGTQSLREGKWAKDKLMGVRAHCTKRLFQAKLRLQLRMFLKRNRQETASCSRLRT